MKGLFSFRRPRQRRLAMTFGYEYRPSLWRKIRNHSHLVIAGAGTLSFLCIAGIALWLAMPSIERSAFANSRQEASLQPLESPQPAAAKAAPQASGTTVAQTATAAPTPSDVRWKDPNAPKEPVPAPAQTSTQAINAEAGDAVVPTEANPSLSAFAAANRAQVNGDQPAAPPAAAKPDDAAETAAIPAVKPDVPADDPEDEAESAPAKAEPSNDAKAAQGHIVHGVTMRAAPKKGAAAMTTIPAKTAVQVLTCAQWCQVVYNGKRGWVYKSFVTRDN